MDRYIVVSIKDAIELGYPLDPDMKEDFDRYQEWYWCLFETDGSNVLQLVGTDAMEPEDATLVRDLRWVVEELNRVAP